MISSLLHPFILEASKPYRHRKKNKKLSIECHRLTIGAFYLKLGHCINQVRKNFPDKFVKGQAFQYLLLLRLFMCFILF